MPGLPAVFGLPRAPALVGLLGSAPWDSGGTALGGSRFQYKTFIPIPGSLLILATATNNHSTLAVSGMGANWIKVASAELLSGNFALSHVWLGFVNGLPLTDQLVVTYSGTNQQAVTVAMFGLPGRKFTPAASLGATHSGSGDLTFGPIGAPGASLGIASLHARAGAISVPTGWTLISTGALAGTGVLAYRHFTAADGGAVSVTWSAPTDNSAGVLALLTPSGWT